MSHVNTFGGVSEILSKLGCEVSLPSYIVKLFVFILIFGCTWLNLLGLKLVIIHILEKNINEKNVSLIFNYATLIVRFSPYLSTVTEYTSNLVVVS